MPGTSSSRAIDPAEVLKHVEFETSEGVEVVPTFDAMGLNKDLLRGISYGFEKPSAIQQRAIQQIVKGEHLIAQAPSGTGKTATISIGVLQSLKVEKRETQALVLAPTRELAVQIQKVIRDLGAYMQPNSHVLSGKNKFEVDATALSALPHVVLGTPGRVFDMIENDKLPTENIHIMFVDEADVVLTKDFGTLKKTTTS